MSSEGGSKSDAGKPRLELLDTVWLNQVGDVLAFGAAKYSPHNWRRGIAHSRLAAAALRHIFAWIGGADKDEESGLPHLAHASCCLMMLTGLEMSRPDLDDRWKS